jgi:transcriptional regulator with XRE-family HTH domain
MRKLDAKTRSAIERMRNLTQKEIARRLGVSVGVVNKVLAEASLRSSMSSGQAIANRRAAKCTVSREVSTQEEATAVEPDDEHARLRRAYSRAESDEDVRATAIALHRHETPDFAECLDRGLSVFSALAQADNVVLDLLCEAEALAYLAQWQADENHDAVALLEGALQILRRPNVN